MCARRRRSWRWGRRRSAGRVRDCSTAEGRQAHTERRAALECRCGRRIAQVGIAGSSSIGARTILAGQVGVAGHLTICDDVIVGAQSGVSKDIENRGMYLGSPALPFDKATKLIAHMSRMSNFKERVAGLENRLAAIEAKAAKAKS